MFNSTSKLVFLIYVFLLKPSSSSNSKMCPIDVFRTTMYFETLLW